MTVHRLDQALRPRFAWALAIGWNVLFGLAIFFSGGLKTNNLISAALITVALLGVFLTGLGVLFSPSLRSVVLRDGTDLRPLRKQIWLVVLLTGVASVGSLVDDFARGATYRDLEAAFPPVQPSSAPALDSALMLRSQLHARSNEFGAFLDARLLDSAIELEPKLPYALLMGPVRIPADAVGGCSSTCAGDGAWNANLLVASTGTEISLAQSRAVIDWCWAHRIPMISAADRRYWIDRGGPLPERSRFVTQLSSRERYDEQAHRSCVGY